MAKRLKTQYWIDAYRSRLAAKFVPCYVVKKGDMEAGALYVRENDEVLWSPQFDYDTNTRTWVVVSEGDAIPRYLERLDRIDPDYWLLDVEKGGGALLMSDGI